MTAPVRIGIVGAAGYAAAHHDAVLKLEEKRLARLICTCDGRSDALAAAQVAWKLRERGVFTFSDYASMLHAASANLDVLVVPSSIRDHEAIHAAALAANVAVYLEKPPTLDPVELERMIERDAAARRKTLVGFNFINEPTRLELKRRILSGEFGPVHDVSVMAIRSRPTSFFQRSAFSGRLVVDGYHVLDSCLSNELGHFVQNGLFWAGSREVLAWPQLATVRAELYRAHLIESSDTVFAEARTLDGATVRFALSQAHAGNSAHRELISCKNVQIEYVVGRGASIKLASGHTEHLEISPSDPITQSHLAYRKYLQGEQAKPTTTLSDCRAFVHLNNLAFVSSGTITAVPAQHVSISCDAKDQRDYLTVAGLTEKLTDFAERRRWPSTTGWLRQRPAALVSPAEMPRIDEILRAMIDPTPAPQNGH